MINGWLNCPATQFEIRYCKWHTVDRSLRLGNQAWGCNLKEGYLTLDHHFCQSKMVVAGYHNLRPIWRQNLMLVELKKPHFYSCLTFHVNYGLDGLNAQTLCIFTSKCVVLNCYDIHIIKLQLVINKKPQKAISRF